MEELNVWINTDELQFVKKVNEEKFEVVNITAVTDDKLYIVQDVKVDFTQLTEREIANAIDGFYDSLDIVKEEYPGEDWKQIVAECYAEQFPYKEEDGLFTTNIDLQNHLKETYGIETEITYDFD